MSEAADSDSTAHFFCYCVAVEALARNMTAIRSMKIEPWKLVWPDWHASSATQTAQAARRPRLSPLEMPPPFPFDKVEEVECDLLQAVHLKLKGCFPRELCQRVAEALRHLGPRAKSTASSPNGPDAAYRGPRTSRRLNLQKKTW